MSRRHVGLATTAGLTAAYAGVQHLGRTWGATREERRRHLPGDDLVGGPKAQTTHAVTIAARPEAIWPWLVQMGWGRAGWYTYRWVDLLLFPANGPSATRLLPEHQRLAVGDHIPDGPPETGCSFTIRTLEPPSVLVLHSDSHLFGRLAELKGASMDWAWTWLLTADAHGDTRVVQRNNLRLTPRWLHLAYVATMVPCDFVMARSHLLGLKRRVERTTSDGGVRQPAA